MLSVRGASLVASRRSFGKEQNPDSKLLAGKIYYWQRQAELGKYLHMYVHTYEKILPPTV